MTFQQQEATQSPSPDLDMEIYYAIGKQADIYIYHNKPFKKELSWLEYDLAGSTLEFIMEDGDIRNFGIPVHKQYGAHLQNSHTISVILQNKHGQAMSGESVPLIVHRP